MRNSFSFPFPRFFSLSLLLLFLFSIFSLVSKNNLSMLDPSMFLVQSRCRTQSRELSGYEHVNDWKLYNEGERHFYALQQFHTLKSESIKQGQNHYNYCSNSSFYLTKTKLCVPSSSTPFSFTVSSSSLPPRMFTHLYDYHYSSSSFIFTRVVRTNNEDCDSFLLFHVQKLFSNHIST